MADSPAPAWLADVGTLDEDVFLRVAMVKPLWAAQARAHLLAHGAKHGRLDLGNDFPKKALMHRIQAAGLHPAWLG